MKQKLTMIVLTVAAYGVVIGAQAPQAPPTSAPRVPPTTQEPTQRPPSPSPPAVPPGASTKADTITVSGCIERSPQSSAANSPAPGGAPPAPGGAPPAPGGAPGAVGTAGSSSRSDSGFMLNVPKPTSAAAGAPSARPTSYRLDGDDSKLSPHVGHKVEITGNLDQASSSTPSSSPKLKVDSVKMIASSCSD